MKKQLFILSLFAMIYVSPSQAQTTSNENPFFSTYKTPHQAPPFDLIKDAHYKPAIIEGIKQHDAEIKKITNNPQVPTFANTLVALDESGNLLYRVESVLDLMTGAQTDAKLEAIEAEVLPLMSEHEDNLYMNEKLFARIKKIHDSDSKKNLTIEQQHLVDKYYKNFVRAGILLNNKDKDRLRDINKELGLLSLQFGKNMLAETNSFSLVIDNKADLAGLSQDIINSASQTAKERGYNGKWVFTLNKPSWIPFLQYAENRNLRKKLYQAMYNRGDNDNANDNKTVVNKIVNLRLEKAQLLGFKSWAAFRLDNTMAKTPGKAMDLLNSIWEYALPQAKKEAADLQVLANKDGQFKIQSWDWWYYTEKLRKQKYSLNEEALTPYFEVDSVRNGVFMVAHKLYGLNFKEVHNLPLYQKDVKTFEIYDNSGKYVGLIYLDYYTRPEKKGGAWMSSLRKQENINGKYTTPIIYNVCNFTPPTADKPCLLSLDDASTLFHEFGHALHGLLSQCHYRTLSGTAVARDFVELPSQLLEHWALYPEVLKMYAKNYKTGEIIPDSLIAKIQNAANFNQGFQTTELLAAAILDMDWHTISAKQDIDVRAFEKENMDKIGLIPEIIPRYRSTYFAHIFDGDYSAGYYSYLWAEVLDADAFAAFEAKGVLNPITAKSFKDNVLSKGGSDDPMTLYKRFRGAEPNPIYLLKNRGFIK